MTEFLHGVQVVNIDTGARSIAIASSSVIGIVGTAPLADTEAFPINTPVLVTSPSQAAKLSATTGADAGTLPGALDAIFDQSSAVVVVVRVEKGANESATLANVLGGVNAQTGAYEGVHALLAAKSIVGVKPRILVAPGFTHVHPADPAKPEAVLANPVVAELLGIADKLSAVIIKDGPNSNDDAAKSTAALTGSKRVYVVDPALLVQSGDAIRRHVEHVPARLEIVEQVGHQLAVVLDHQQTHARNIHGSSYHGSAAHVGMRSPRRRSDAFPTPATSEWPFCSRSLPCP